MRQDGSTRGYIGPRLREIRVWRELTQQVVADRAGLTKQFVSQVELGQKSVERRSTLEALASALQVAPSELAGQPMLDMLADPDIAAAQATIAGLEAALTDVDFGEATVAPREWPAVATDLAVLNDQLRPTADYAAQGTALPDLITELNALIGSAVAPQRDVLIGLVQCYHAASVVARNLGVRGLPALATWHARRVAEALEDPAWLGLAGWLRSVALGTTDRARAVAVATSAADELQHHLGDDTGKQMYGALHLQAAMAAAARLDAAGAVAHLDEAADVAAAVAPREDPRGFGSLYFGPANVGIWRLAMAVELGEPWKAQELAAQVDPADVPSAARQSSYWSDLGRGLAATRSTRESAVRALRQAEDVAPVYTRTRPLVRETVTHLLPRVKRDTPAGRELRGMAWRMGLAG